MGGSRTIVQTESFGGGAKRIKIGLWKTNQALGQSILIRALEDIIGGRTMTRGSGCELLRREEWQWWEERRQRKQSQLRVACSGRNSAPQPHANWQSCSFIQMPPDSRRQIPT